MSVRGKIRVYGKYIGENDVFVIGGREFIKNRVTDVCVSYQAYLKLQQGVKDGWFEILNSNQGGSSTPGPQGPQGPQGERGPQGPQGKDGADGINGINGKDGITPNIMVGTVTTLEAGQQATVTKRGTKEEPIFDFGIPRGESSVGGSDENAGVAAKSDKVDYMGKQHNSIKEASDSNVEYLLRKTSIQKYEGSNITANNTYMKQVNNVILKGITKYKDMETGEFITGFEEGKTLELIGGRGSVIQIKNKLTAKDLICTASRTMSYSVDDNTLNMSSGSRWSRACFNFDYQAGVPYNVSFYSEKQGNYCVDFNKDNSNRTTFNVGAFTKDFTPSGTQPLQIADISGNSKMALRDFFICKAQHKNDPYKSIEITLLMENSLYAIGDTYDYIDLVTGVYVQNIGKRTYQEGDESNDEVMTDMKNTIYKLDKPVVSKIDLQEQKIYSYDGTTYYTCQFASRDAFARPITL